MFVIYMLLVTILLINMLIASMTNTYQQVRLWGTQIIFYKSGSPD